MEVMFYCTPFQNLNGKISLCFAEWFDSLWSSVNVLTVCDVISSMEALAMPL